MVESRKLFEELAEQRAPQVCGSEGGPRYVLARRDEIEFRRFEFDELIGPDHVARIVWAYAEGVDLTALYDAIRAYEHGPGRPPPDPRVILGLWLYACVEGVGSARALERLSEEHHGFMWLRGGVPANYHLLSDFRRDNGALVDRLLSEGVAGLASQGLIELQTLAVDGVRIRAAAGSASFRRRQRLEDFLADAQQRVARLKQELDADPDASNQRLRAARERAARERQERVQAALQALRDRGGDDPPPPAGGGTATKKKKAKEPRASTTDAPARVMRMADGGWRPAYNMQVTSDPASSIVTGIAVDTTGSDGGLMAPAVERFEAGFAQRPRRWLADGGFTTIADIVSLAAKGIELFCPAKPRRNPKNDPAAPRPGDPPAVAQWRLRMVHDQAAGPRSWMRQRAKAERFHAVLRQRGLWRFTVRGIDKVRTALTWHALAHNIVTAHRLTQAKAV
jgi:transposase